MLSESWLPFGPREDSQRFPLAMERVLRVSSCAAMPTIFSSTQSAGAFTSAVGRASSTSLTREIATIVDSPESPRSAARALRTTFRRWTGCFLQCAQHRWSRRQCGCIVRCLEWDSKEGRANEVSDFEDRVFIPYLRSGFRRSHDWLD